MNQAGLVPWNWRPDPEPLEPEGAVAWHAASRALHAKVAQLPASQQARLMAVASRDLFFVVGAAADLPWVSGVAYAARCAESPELWRPTLRKPDVSADLLYRALRKVYLRAPLMLWHEPAHIVPLDRLVKVSAEWLERVAQRWRDA